MESLESRRLLTVTLLTTGSISDSSFEAPALPANAYQVLSPGTPGAAAFSSPWNFSGVAGVSANASAFTTGDPKAPSGNQVAFIQDNASISQTVDLDAGVYDLSMFAAQRVNYQTQAEGIEVLIDGAEVGMIVPNIPVTANNKTYTTTYATYETSNFTVTAGLHVVEFLGTSPASADSTAFIDNVAISPVVDGLVDGGFETPALASNAYATDANGSAWQFSETAGLSRDGSDFQTNWVEAQNAPAGMQVGYVESTIVNGVQNNGSISQTVYLDAGTYQLSFLAAQRAIYQTNYEEIEILVDGVQIGTPINPVNTLYGSYQSLPFAVTTSVHTIEFLGVAPLGGDNTAFIDQVTLTANSISDGSFETPNLNAGTYQFAPTGSPWQYTGTAGVAHNGSAFTYANGKAPDGSQVALIKGTGSMSQSVDLIAGEYNISFLAAQRAGNSQSQGQQIEVLVDGAVVGLITPADTTYRVYETANFQITSAEAATAATIEFLGTDPSGGDNTALIDEVGLAAAQDQIIDGGFETPGLVGGGYVVAPSGTPWQYSGLAGISYNNSGLTSGTVNAPYGAQVGFLMNNGSMSQTVYLDANTYNISFMAIQRAAGQTQPQQIEVLVDGAAVGLITPVNSNMNALTGATSTPTYTLYQTSNFTELTAGVHTIEFLGTSPAVGQSTAFIDQVSLTAVENAVSDGNFASPVMPGYGYQFAPSDCAWQFSGSAGLSGNYSAFTSVVNGSLNAPSGVQVAFIKDNASISQTVDFDAGTYNITFDASQRAVTYQSQPQQIEVLIDGTQVGLITPALALATSSTASNMIYTYTPYQTLNFPVTAGPHTITFLGLSPASADSTAFVAAVTINTGSAISDGSFEEPALAWKTFQAAPTGTAWQFSGNAGVSNNASAYTFGNPVAPDGDQVAYLKDNASMSQSVYLAAGVYNLSFMAAQRYYYQTQNQVIEVLVDGVEVGTATPDAPGKGAGQYPAGTTFGLYATSSFTEVTAGVHTIEFVGLSPASADSTAFIDDVVLNV